MGDRAGFLAGLGDTLSELCAYYLVGGLFIMARRGWGLHLGWLLLWGGVCAAVFALVMQKPRTVPVLTALTGALFLGGMALFILASRTTVGFGYGLVLAVGAGMAAGLPLHFCLHRPGIYGHLTHLDVLICVLLVLLVCQKPMELDGATVGLTAAVLFLDAASAVGLRMTGAGGEDGGDVAKASLVALGGAAGVAALTGLLTAVFSRSGSVTGAVFHAVGRFFAAIGRGIEGFFQWLAQLLYRPEQYEAIPLEGELPSVAEAELQGGGMDLALDPVAVGVGIAVLVIAAAVVIAVLGRKRVLRRGTAEDPVSAGHTVRRRVERPSLWRRLMEALRFRWTVFRHRNTPAGLLMRLERRGRRRKTPRQTGETMRAFIRRMDPSGGLEPLADALDREYYGGQGRAMPPRECRALGRTIRRLPAAGK